MKCVILAGGLGTRLSEETYLKPKPMVEIGGRPILWHIMKIYSTFNVRDFIICCGYKGYIIKEYFANYALHMSDVTFDMVTGQLEVHQRSVEPWRVTLVDTGDDSLTGGRLKSVSDHVFREEQFCFTYGDGVADVDVGELVQFHKSHGKLATLTAVQPPGRYGAIDLAPDGLIHSFIEKPKGDSAWINGGFFVLSPKVLELIEGSSTAWEGAPLNALAKGEQLMAYRHHGFWHPMDTLRDMNALENLWQANQAPWKTW